MTHEEVPDVREPLALPIGETFVSVYRHIWHYRWPYLTQLAIWSAMMWLRQYPTLLILDTLEWVGLYWWVSDFDVTWMTVAGFTKLLVATLGGGLIFLSCSCALLIARRPRSGDALRLPPVRRFWFAALLFWIAVSAVPAILFQAYVLYLKFTPADVTWLNLLAAQLAYFVSPVPIWALIALALPIAAFEKSAVPFREAWHRLRNHWANALVLTIIVAAPIVALQVILERTSFSLRLTMLPFEELEPLTRFYVRALDGAGILASFALALVLSASTALVYKRLSPDAADVAQKFD
ncbi:MAG TPA: hypothetical protein VH835_15660 [Dongiaceae bacterium]